MHRPATILSYAVHDQDNVSAACAGIFDPHDLEGPATALVYPRLGSLAVWMYHHLGTPEERERIMCELTARYGEPVSVEVI